MEGNFLPIHFQPLSFLRSPSLPLLALSLPPFLLPVERRQESRENSSRERLCCLLSLLLQDTGPVLHQSTRATGCGKLYRRRAPFIFRKSSCTFMKPFSKGFNRPESLILNANFMYLHCKLQVHFSKKNSIYDIIIKFDTKTTVSLCLERINTLCTCAFGETKHSQLTKRTDR